jgi:hypothetical protein
MSTTPSALGFVGAEPVNVAQSGFTPTVSAGALGIAQGPIRSVTLKLAAAMGATTVTLNGVNAAGTVTPLATLTTGASTPAGSTLTIPVTAQPKAGDILTWTGPGGNLIRIVY